MPNLSTSKLYDMPSFEYGHVKHSTQSLYLTVMPKHYAAHEVDIVLIKPVSRFQDESIKRAVKEVVSA